MVSCLGCIENGVKEPPSSLWFFLEPKVALPKPIFFVSFFLSLDEEFILRIYLRKNKKFKQLESRRRIQDLGLSQASILPLAADLQTGTLCQAIPTEGMSERNYIEEQEKPWGSDEVG